MLLGTRPAGAGFEVGGKGFFLCWRPGVVDNEVVGQWISGRQPAA